MRPYRRRRDACCRIVRGNGLVEPIVLLETLSVRDILRRTLDSEEAARSFRRAPRRADPSGRLVGARCRQRRGLGFPAVIVSLEEHIVVIIGTIPPYVRRD
jgi:hypothetical protein